MSIWSLCWEDPLDEKMATHPNILPGKNPTRTEEPGELAIYGVAVRPDSVTEYTHTVFLRITAEIQSSSVSLKTIKFVKLKLYDTCPVHFV